MTYPYTPSGAKHTSYTFPDGSDTGAAGAAAASAALEAIADTAAHVGALSLVDTYRAYSAATAEIHSNAAATTYGTGDYDIYPTGWDVVDGDVIDFTVLFQVLALAASGQRFTVGYSIGAGAVTQLAGFEAIFDALGSNAVPLTLATSIHVVGASGKLHLWIRSKCPGGTQAGKAYSPFRATINHWRPTT